MAFFLRLNVTVACSYGGAEEEAGEEREPEGLLGEEAAVRPCTVHPSQAGRRAQPAACWALSGHVLGLGVATFHLLPKTSEPKNVGMVTMQPTAERQV